MADEKKEETKTEKKSVEQKPMKQAKNASVDYLVEVESTDGDKYHDNGVKFEVGHKNALALEKRGAVTITEKGKKKIAELKAAGVAFMLAMLFAFTSFAQTSVLADLKSPYSVNSDTVTNTGTAYLTSARVNGAAQTTTIQVNVTKISGTVGGTISLQGSLDGTNFKALNTEETQTALATITATDATNVYHWRLKNSPFLYYRVSWTGTGTMAASFTAKLMKH